MPNKHLLTVALIALAPATAQAQDVQGATELDCARGDYPSCTLVGLMYETGAAGVRDFERALALYERACGAGVAAGCVRLDLARERGAGVDVQDDFVRVGYVADEATGEPVGGALVSLPSLDVQEMADEAGRVELGRLRRGRHTIVTRRMGYQDLDGELPVPWEGDFLILMNRTLLEDDEPHLGRIFGRVTEGDEGLSDVDITLLGPRTRTVSDPQGRFQLGSLEPGTFEVRFERLGYESRTTSLTVQAGRTVEVSLEMSTRPIQLEPVIVTIGSGYLERSGFYRRAGSAWGSRFTRTDLVEIDPSAMSDVLLRAPGVSVTQGVRGARIVSRRRNVRDGGRACELRPYLDGAPMIDFDVDQVNAADLEGVEVYQGLGAPIEYRNLVNPDGSYPCGVVLIWTRRRE